VTGEPILAQKFGNKVTRRQNPPKMYTSRINVDLHAAGGLHAQAVRCVVGDGRSAAFMPACGVLQIMFYTALQFLISSLVFVVEIRQMGV